MKVQIIFNFFLLLLINKFNSEIVPNRYLVTFKQVPGVRVSSHADFFNELIRSRSPSNNVIHLFEVAGNGVSAIIDPITVGYVKNLPYVEKVSPVGIVSTKATQQDAPWGLARFSRRDKLGNPPYSFRYKDNGGEGVDVYVLDTGVYIQNEDFQGRAVWGITIPQNSTDADVFGHGTHCAGTIAGSTYGAAKKARVIAVKVLKDDGYGTLDDVIAGIEWVMKNANHYRRSVISMSLGTTRPNAPGTEEVNKAVSAAVDKGVFTVVAAGNSNSYSCVYAPSNAEKAFTVGATSISDEFASFSNWGKCVHILAPGIDIKSTWIGSPTATLIDSGTSMACPHIAGLAAALLSFGVKPQELRQKLLQLATKDAISGVRNDTVNLLGYYPSY